MKAPATILRGLIAALALLAGAGAGPTTRITIESLDGPVTAAEVESFKSFISSLPLPTTNKGNAMVYGSAGGAVEAMGAMVEVTRDRQILDRMLEFADAMLAARNHPETGRVLWTGKRDPVWPNKAENDKQAKYSGTENGDVIAHIAYAALLVLQDKSLDDRYRDRARSLVRECDRTIDEFILPWLVDEKTNRYHFPDSPLYGALGEREQRARGKSVPWNQQMMLNGGFQRLAECHELLGDDPQRVKRYDAIVKTSCDAFLSEVVKYDVDGHECYKWSYAAGDKALRYVEDTGHAGYDILICRAYASGRYGITLEQLLPFANTVHYVISKGNGRFAWRVDGKGDTRDYLGGTFMYLCEVKPELYPLVAAACAKRAETNPLSAARILWAKHRRVTTTSKGDR